MKLRHTALIAGLAAASIAGLAQAQLVTQSGTPIRATRVIPQRATAQKLLRPVTVSFQDQRLEDVFNFVRDFTGADILPLYADDKFNDGLDPDATITLDVQGVSALQLIEMVLEQAETEFSTDGNSWQFTPTGTFEAGPKERLNKHRRIEVYNIADMLILVPDYPDAPTFDLNSILQSSGGGGGGQSPFQGGNQNQTNTVIPLAERADDIRLLLTELVEPNQWIDNGGDAASIRYWQGNFIVNAPDYVHRELNGYPWWPASATRVTMVQGRRYVTLNSESSFAEVEDFVNQPISAVVGGRIVRSDDPGGGG